MEIQKSNVRIKGVISWKIIDIETGEILKENKNQNLVTDSYVESIADAQLDVNNLLVADEIRIGTNDTAFTSASTALGALLDSGSVSPTVVDSDVFYEYTFTFGASHTIEEAGVFDSVNNLPLTLSNAISEAVTPQQALTIQWAIYHNN